MDEKVNLQEETADEEELLTRRMEFIYLSDRINEVKRDLSQQIEDLRRLWQRLDEKIDTKIESLRAELKEDIAGLETKMEAVRVELREDIAKLDAKIEAVRIELKEDITALREELKGDIAALREELKGDIAALREELKKDIARLEARMDRMEYELREEIARSANRQLRWTAIMLGVLTAIIAVLFTIISKI